MATELLPRTTEYPRKNGDARLPAAAKFEKNGHKHPQWPKIEDALTSARRTGNAPFLNDTTQNPATWTYVDWLCHFVYSARLVLFNKEDLESFATSGVPEKLQDDQG